MKSYPRIRKTIKWGGAAVTVLLVVVWIGSGWGSVSWRSPRGYCFTLEWGQLQCLYANWWFCTPNSRGVDMGLSAYSIGKWGINWQCASYFIHDANTWGGNISLLPIVVFTFLLTALAFRLDTLARRRARIGLCPKCHYDRTGLAASAVCPECGAAGSTSPSLPPSP